MTTAKFFALSALMLTYIGIDAKTVELNGIKYDLDAGARTAVASYADASLTHAVIEPVVSSDGVEYTVTSLADRGFYGCRGLQSVSLPATVTSIGSFAFMACTELTRVDIPTLADWLEINFSDGFSNPLVYAGNLYVGGELLQNLVLPDGLERVPDHAFLGSSIVSAAFPASLTEIGMLAFYQCESLRAFEAGPALAIIGTQAFDGCTALESIVLGPAVETVRNYAFNDCAALTDVTFGPSVATVGSNAFANCGSLHTVNVADVATWCRIDFADEGANPLGRAGQLLIGGRPLVNIVIPEGITEIKNSRFAGCKSLESVSFDGDVTTIGDNAFEGCGALRECALPTSLTSVGSYAFYGTAITEAVVPEGVTVLPEGVFGECESLASVSLPEGLQSVGFGCFYECTALKEIELPATVQKIGKSAFNGCSALAKVTLGNDLESISAFAFGSCTALTDIYVAASEPPVAPESAFANYTATLHVPQNSVAAYTADSTWGRFTDICPYGSGISLPVQDPSDAYITVTTLDGRIIYHGPASSFTPNHGIYIISTPEHTCKVKL